MNEDTQSTTISKVVKRDGRVVEFDPIKIKSAINKAFLKGKYSGEVVVWPSTDEIKSLDGKEVNLMAITEAVVKHIDETYRGMDEHPTIEFVQDTVVRTLKEMGYGKVGNTYMNYRNHRTKVREGKTALSKTLAQISAPDDCDIKRDNANINGQASMGSMLMYGQEAAKDYNWKHLLKPEHAEAFLSGNIYIHDFDFYQWTLTCVQTDLRKMFNGGFTTGHGHIRKPSSIRSYAALACIVIQSAQNDMHGGQSIHDFDYAMADGIRMTFAKVFYTNLERFVQFETLDDSFSYKPIVEYLEKTHPGEKPTLDYNETFMIHLSIALTKCDVALDLDNKEMQDILKRLHARSVKDTDKETYQAMEALVHNLCSMHSRAGSQVPFSSINYGTDTTSEGRMAIKNILLATDAGLGKGETAIFPIHVFREMSGVNYNPEDPNYDLWKLACKVSAKRLFPNFMNLDATFNRPFYKGTPETLPSTMGCRTRVVANVYDSTRQVSVGRGNCSFTSLNLPRYALEANGDEKKFYEILDKYMNMAADQIYDRLCIQGKRQVKNFPFLMGQGIWMDSDKLQPDDEIFEIIKHGSLSIGFIGIAETLTALFGKHHGECEEMEQKGIEIVQHMRDFVDRKAAETHLNYSLLATPAEGLSGKFLRMDQKKFGIIKGVTDKPYYTNGFHIPVGFDISAFDKIRLEGPYHALCNAGHISYVECDGDPSNNLEAFEAIIRAMHDANMGYYSINHKVDRCPRCGWTGIINDECPDCHALDSNTHFERLRRITGYLVGTVDRFNDAKKAEEHDRVTHMSVK